MFLDNFIEGLNLQKNDTILMTANSKKIFRKIKKEDRNFNFNILIDKIIDKIGEDGTLIIQTFNWNFCNKVRYDIKQSESQTGVLGNIVLNRRDFSRTKHPIYSFSVTGKYKDALVKLNNKGAFDKDSPFNFMIEKKVKMIIIDLPLQTSFTFVHHVEEMEKVGYRYNKSFTADYADINGDTKVKTYDMYVRDIENNVITDIHKLEDIFIDNNVMIKYDIDGIVIREIDLYKSYAIIKKDIDDNNAKSLYKIEGKEND